MYRRVKRRHHLFGALAGLSTSALLVIIWPIPIHGGFTFLGEIMLEEFIDQWDLGQGKAEVRKDERFLQSLEARFAGTLQFEHDTVLSGDWSTVTLAGVGVAWLDNHSGLVWSKPLVLTQLIPWGH